MKRKYHFLVLLVLVSTALGSCKKENEEHCYVCDFEGNGEYRDAGCMSNKDWDEIQFTDSLGGTINKNDRCVRVH